VSETILFAGPTLARAQTMTPAEIMRARLTGVRLAPPVKRGDLPACVAATAPGTLVLVDGLFHAALAVGHAEIRDALAAGWQVWGLSSMGAIRAREMQHLGMRGFGQVFALYCQPDVDFRDDEVTLLHEGRPPWRELSEPLVHLRAALTALQARQLISTDAVAAILDELMQLWFGDRTLPWLLQRLTALVPPEELTRLVQDFDRYRLKSLDLLRFLDERPDLRPPRSAPPPRRE
jgi:hypothetical protein